ncbi:hypothetical protein RDWZM_002297 [Blomia tropicalis]|uniref:Uncharacterized protein n=1 Tax=Blomia tropicalis TaxID=40697 RepID=A0A9Q0MFV7_BLOTA|nr:hypothetical protein RDWZM_002297 [Blomia tropicalis]
MNAILLVTLLTTILGNVHSKSIQSENAIKEMTSNEAVETTTYDWGKHTGSTYDWGKHTGSTYDWGKHTSTKAPDNTKSDSDSSRTTYDWGKHTGSTYDWGKHTGSTYDWGKHTSTQSPNNNNHTDSNEEDQHRCGPGTYSCAGAPGLCIPLEKICNGIIDCPSMDDEEPRACHPEFVKPNHAGNVNRFRGQGFMFEIRNILIRDASKVELFDQNSDNKNE